MSSSKFKIENKPHDWNKLPLFKKIQYSINKLNKNFSPYVDKLNAKKIVKKMCGDEIKVPKTIRVLKDYTDISTKDFIPNQIIKAAHSSGCNIIIKPDIKENKIEKINKILCHHNRLYNPNIEPQYKYLKPTFFIEEIIDDKQFGRNGNAITYMLRCIHGIPYTITFLNKRKDMQCHYLYNEDKTIKIIEMNYERLKQKKFNYNIEMPTQYVIEKMYNLASTLSKPFEFVRIDFYIGKDDNIYFSEFTFSPDQGKQNFNIELEHKLGSYWI